MLKPEVKVMSLQVNVNKLKQTNNHQTASAQKNEQTSRVGGSLFSNKTNNTSSASKPTSIFSCSKKAGDDNKSVSTSTSMSNARSLYSASGNNISEAKDSTSSSKENSSNALKLNKNSMEINKNIQKEEVTATKTLKQNGAKVDKLAQQNKKEEQEIKSINRQIDSESRKAESEQESQSAQPQGNEQNDATSLKLPGQEKDENSANSNKANSSTSNENTTSPFSKTSSSGSESTNKIQSLSTKVKSLSNKIKSNGNTIQQIAKKNTQTASATKGTINNYRAKAQENANEAKAGQTKGQKEQEVGSYVATTGGVATGVGTALCSNQYTAAYGAKLKVAGGLMTTGGTVAIAAGKKADGDNAGAFQAAGSAAQSASSSYSSYNNAATAQANKDQQAQESAKKAANQKGSVNV